MFTTETRRHREKSSWLSLLQMSCILHIVILNEVKNLLFFNNLQYRRSLTNVQDYGFSGLLQELKPHNLFGYSL